MSGTNSLGIAAYLPHLINIKKNNTKRVLICGALFICYLKQWQKPIFLPILVAKNAIENI